VAIGLATVRELLNYLRTKLNLDIYQIELMSEMAPCSLQVRRDRGDACGDKPLLGSIESADQASSW
jgi:hypothetical protein